MKDEGLAVQPDTSSVYGILKVSGTLMALSAENLREVVPRPEKLSNLPFGGSGLIGAMSLRNDTIPLIDLSSAIGLYGEKEPDAGIAVIVNHEEKLVALLADGIHGIATVKQSNTRVYKSAPHAHERQVFTHDGIVVTILSISELLDSMNLPTIDAAPREALAEVQRGNETFLLCGYADHNLAFRASEVEATIPLAPLSDSPIAVGDCDGVVSYHGRDVPMIDTLSALGLGRNATAPKQSAGVVVRFPGDGLLTFEVDVFHDVVRLGNDQIIDRPDVVTRKPHLFDKAHIDATDRSFLIVDIEKCRRDPALMSFAETSLSDGSLKSKTLTAENAQQLYLVFKAAVRTCCPILQAYEIIRIPKTILEKPPSFDGYMGTITQRGQIVPIYCTARLIGRHTDYSVTDSGILLVRRENALFGFMVEQFEEVSKARIAERDRYGNASVAQRHRDADLIPITDFEALINRVAPPPAPAPAEEGTDSSLEPSSLAS